MTIPSGDARQEDLDDFVVECDEHLAAARRSLLDFEAEKDLASAGRETLDGLFRAFHTIKGLSGMVGARGPETAAHVLEAYLAAVRNGDPPLTQAGVDALLDGVTVIETAIAAFLRGTEGPDAAGLAARVTALLPTSRTETPIPDPSEPSPDRPDHSAESMLPPEKRSRLDAALLRGERAWRVMFVPSAALAARGVNVTTARTRMQAVGEIIHAQPVPTPGGVQFQFLVAASPGVDFRSWADDGIVAEPYGSPPPRESVAATAPTGGLSSNYVRVDLRRLDDLMRTVGELVLSRARLADGLGRAAKRLSPADRRELEETTQTIERQLRDLREEVMRVRMVPVRDLFARMRLVVRDLTRETGHDVELAATGEDTEVDKFVVERMADPLLHLVRNAVSHGLEPAAERIAAGKPARGRVTLSAAASGGMVVLAVEDDGRGVRVEEVFARAKEAGLVPASAPDDPAAVLDLLCAPGFSTRGDADRASGRGVGMDVVRVAVEALGGSLSLDTRPGLGSRFTVRLPLTLAIADVLTVAVGGQTYAIPQAAVREVVPVEPGATTILENNELVRYRGRAVPLLRIGDIFGVPRPAHAIVALVTGDDAGAVALGADRAIGLREVVVRALADPLVQAPGIGGATELGDGRPILILDPGGLARLARRRTAATTSLGG